MNVHGWIGVVLGLVVGACAANSGRQCTVGADCASGICMADGRCVPVDADAGAGDAFQPDAPEAVDAAVDAPAADAPAMDAGDGGGIVCAPNRDGIIERAEVPIRAGLRATFRGATDVAFNTAGTMVEGVRTWDLSADFTGDRMVLVETADPSGEWFDSDYPGATYVTPLSLESDLLGVFEVDGSTLSLRGVVSPDEGFDRTNLENDPAVSVLQFPLSLGASWESDVTVSGLALGIFSNYTETYSSEVDAEGTLVTPFGRFDVLRVRTELRRTVGFAVTTKVSFALVTECFGTVAVLTGNDNDDGDELIELAEVRRLAP